MSSDYFMKLDDVARSRYREKLLFEGEELPDLLDDDLRPMHFWGTLLWPSVMAIDIFM